MPDFESLYPGRFLKKELLPEPKVIRITKITGGVKLDEDSTETKTIIAYKSHDGEGEIVWCKTNAKLIAAALDERDYTKWPGRLITIFHDPRVRKGGKTVGGIRVFGSPEMKAPKTLEFEMPRRKKPEVYHLVPTTNSGKPKTGAAPDTAPAPPVDDGPPMDDEREAGEEG